MLKKLFFAAALASASLAAHADEVERYFQYTGFYVNGSSTFNPSRVLQGSFGGNDNNSNGVLEVGELSSMRVGGTQFVDCGSNEVWCGVWRFSYTQDGKLDFDVGTGYADEGSQWGYTVESGVRLDSWVGGSYYHTYQWGPETRLQISASPIIPAVPEPTTWAMLLVGLLGMAGLRARRRRA